VEFCEVDKLCCWILVCVVCGTEVRKILDDGRVGAGGEVLIIYDCDVY
jgi:hypothetical protein